ncbi:MULTISPECIES: CHAT domain-containing protein [unclassified Mesorhizobium]|uniref:CHAT domain-containing protein n=1 Tax=unclassified Mesorhizobium TaxID=325217 RepID=UPI0003CDEA39|nr:MULTISPECIES: CHAT domain-containing protein [unclassified Mesorhizobium]ESY22458.1 hypothetical protein X751_08725 [Mesorhizobium sp. LNJC395A00]WJI76757.1 CHAT domain-containing protein [Mesorhizobium sp. C395A]
MPKAKTALIEPQILYFIVVAEDDPMKVSPLQGFSFGMTAAASLFHPIVSLPADVIEMAMSIDVQAGRRTNGTGSWQWTPAAAYALEGLNVPPETPFWVMLTHDAPTASKVDRWIQTQRYRPLHISEANAKGRISLENADATRLLAHFRKILSLVVQDKPTIDHRMVSQGLKNWTPRLQSPFARPVPEHNISLPNVMALQGVGYSFEGSGPFVGADPAAYMNLIAELANQVLDRRERTYSSPAFRTTPPQPDIYVTAPSLYSDVYENGLNLALGPDRAPVRDLLQMMRKQTKYQMHGSGKTWSAIIKSEAAQAVLHLRAMETKIQVVAAGLTAASTLSATVRVPPAVNRAQGAIRQLASHARTERIKPPAKLVKTFSDVQQSLAKAVGPELCAVIERSRIGVKLITDVPLEWLPLGNLPLMLRKDVSRITTTPGNLLIGLLARNQLLHLAADAFRTVLVISALDPSEPIANVLLETLAHWGPTYGDKISVKVVKVTTRREFVAALNAFAGAVVVFDGHGTHDPVKGFGTLTIGREDISIWEMRNEIRVPPVVILSACDTQAAARSHATTANAFLNAGAMTVVASLLPVRAYGAAMLIGRLIWRLAEFLPAVTGKRGRAVLWSEVMAGMLRLQLVYDLLMPLVDQRLLIKQQYRDITMQAIFATANREPDWWDEALNSVGSILRLDAAALDSLGRKVVATSDAVRYTQVGNPERIVIKSKALLQEVGYDTSSF